MNHDIFNGDADGLCALIQLRLHQPREARLITGVKRDIQLLQQVPLEPVGQITVLDVALKSNRAALDPLLAAGHEILYIDHHNPGDELPAHPRFTPVIDTRATVCTSLLVHQWIGQRFPLWAITAAFGDNLIAVAEGLADALGLGSQQTAQLRELGICLNYNGYGATLEDLHFHPAQLFRELLQYPNPLDFLNSESPIWNTLRQGYQEDLQQGLTIEPLYATPACALLLLPDCPWARRVSGILNNELANRFPQRAHAIASPLPDGDLSISIRSPKQRPEGADLLAMQFPTGGGRKGAAGINRLPVDQLGILIDAMQQHFGSVH